MKKIMILLLMIVFLAAGASAHTAEDFQKAMTLVGNDTPCQNLTEDDFEIIGDYYMEQMHPGNMHEYMDERMGGEGSGTLEEFHIAMGKSIYCNDYQDGSFPMMMRYYEEDRNYGSQEGYGGGMMNWNNGGYGMHYMNPLGFYLGSLLVLVLILIAGIGVLAYLLLKKETKRRN